MPGEFLPGCLEKGIESKQQEKEHRFLSLGDESEKRLAVKS